MWVCRSFRVQNYYLSLWRTTMRVIGGSGSGRHNRTSRLTTEQARYLDVRDVSAAIRRGRGMLLRIPWHFSGPFASVFPVAYVSLRALGACKDAAGPRYRLSQLYSRFTAVVTMDTR